MLDVVEIDRRQGRGGEWGLGFESGSLVMMRLMRTDMLWQQSREHPNDDHAPERVYGVSISYTAYGYIDA